MMNSEPTGPDMFDSYAQEFQVLIKSLTKKIDQDIQSSQGEVRKALIRQAEREFEEGEEILSQLDMEMNHLPKSSRANLQLKVKEYRSNLTNLKREFKRCQAQLSAADRDELLLGARGSVGRDASQHDQRSKLLTSTERLNQAGARLDNSHRLALETEQLGAGILTDLRAQREQILREADSHVDEAQRTLREMARRMMANKAMGIGMVILLVALILLILYFRSS